jgi:hypothetical protein
MTDYIPKAMRRAVEERANYCCEYCRLAQGDTYLPHEIEHIIAIKHRGLSDIPNLGLACFDCNRFKGSDIASYDLETGALTPLFNPRRDRWEDHFRLNGASIVPLTAIGRVTEFILNMNSREQLQRRTLLIAIKRYPCQPGQ